MSQFLRAADKIFLEEEGKFEITEAEAAGEGTEHMSMSNRPSALRGVGGGMGWQGVAGYKKRGVGGGGGDTMKILTVRQVEYLVLPYWPRVLLRLDLQPDNLTLLLVTQVENLRNPCRIVIDVYH